MPQAYWRRLAGTSLFLCTSSKRLAPIHLPARKGAGKRFGRRREPMVSFATSVTRRGTSTRHVGRDRPVAGGRSGQTTGGVGLPYLPGLDGLRALAVVTVLLYHAELPWLPGGFLGVEVFFVISGYLITALLLAEWRQ